ncbi:MAG: hypothetical protein WKF77_11430 [Planctomycetaceae bacterium]
MISKTRLAQHKVTRQEQWTQQGSKGDGVVAGASTIVVPVRAMGADRKASAH